MGKSIHEGSVLVVGLGRFGSALAEDLQRLGHDVMAVDASGTLVQEWSDRLTHVVQADATNEAAMRQLGADGFSVAVVAIGTGIEASVLSTGVLIDLGVREVWAKAITASHGRILERIGAGHVVYPERDTGRRVAHLISGRLIDYIEFDDGFAIAKLRAPREAHGRTLAETALRSRYGITVVGVKRPGQDFTYAQPHTEVGEGDLLIVSGATNLVEKFAAETGS
ncbi:MAG TPA: TrkA family potassium uptake protein [Mycobacteriales bacterium]|nr:TrkA family potassium uptake protein [Mycobacteriales bacterium]